MDLTSTFQRLNRLVPATLRPFRAKLPILFIHTPKTGGTSFREAALESIKIKHVLCDYGKDNLTNTPTLNEARYHLRDGPSVESILEESQEFILMGHFLARQYMHLFYPYEIGLFVRNPTERIISDYFHAKRKDRFNGELRDYLELERSINIQSKQLCELLPQYLGFIGISERFADSLDLVNKQYRLGLKHIIENLNPDKETETYDVSGEVRKRIAELNSKDFSLYNTAVKLLESRESFANNKHPTLYGSFHLEDSMTLFGRAYRAYTESAIALDIKLNGELVTTVNADLYSPIPCDVKQPRKGHIGFQYSFETPLSESDEITITASDTREPIFNSERLI